jgi:hypothetical protein
MHKIELVRFSEISKQFCSLEALLPTLIIEWKAKFNLGVRENILIICFPSSFTNPLKSVLGTASLKVNAKAKYLVEINIQYKITT